MFYVFFKKFFEGKKKFLDLTKQLNFKLKIK